MGFVGLFLNWLVTHLVVLGFLGFLLVGLLFRESLLGSDREAEEAVHVSAMPTEEIEPPMEKEKPVQLPAVKKPGPVEKLPDEESGRAEKQLRPEPESVANPPSRPLPASNSVFRPAAGKFGSSKPSSPTEVAHFRNPDKQPVIEDNDADKKAQLNLSLARDAFSKEQYGRAEDMYLRYLGERPEDAVAFSELGNLYRVMGREQDAMDAYFEAAVRFMDRGDIAEVRQLQGILQRAGDPRAANLTGHVR